MSGHDKEFFAVIVGAGPAGLTASYRLAQAGKPVLILESDPEYVGGISRTVSFREFHFDVGGHRFFSKSKEINELWDELLPNEFQVRPRASRIFYRKKFFSYPLRPAEVFRKLGLAETILSMASYVKAKLFPHPRADTVEGWMINSFGRRLFTAFFKGYTEKVWGIPCAEISSNWAAQRIKGLSVKTLIWNWLVPHQNIKSLIESFKYPPRGPGMMWNACAARVRELGGEILMGHKAESYVYDAASGKWTVGFTAASGEKNSVVASHVICSAPIGEVVARISPAREEKVLVAASSLRHRDFMQVALVLTGPELFPDNWLYIHDQEVRVGRLQNFRAWSPEMAPAGEFFSYGAEYFCARGDSLWELPDGNLIEFALRELRVIGLLRDQKLVFGKVIRQPRAYPLYDAGYEAKIALLRQGLAAGLTGIHFVGRNGMHKYNNQDHAMMTAIIVAENILAGSQLRDPWNVNQDAEYIEASAAASSVQESWPSPAHKSQPSLDPIARSKG